MSKTLRAVPAIKHMTIFAAKSMNIHNIWDKENEWVHISLLRKFYPNESSHNL